MRVYCGLASAGQRIPVAVVDDAGRLLASQEVDDTPAGYAAVCALIADRCAETGSVRAAMATDSESNLVSMLLAASGEPLAVADPATIAPFLPGEQAGQSQPQQRAVALARALQAGALAASSQPAPRDLAALRPVLSAHRAATTGRTASVAMLREMLRELYPAALRTFPDPGTPLALAVLERLADPVQVARGQAGEVIGQLAAAGHPEAENAVASLHQALADTSGRSSGSEAVGATVRSGVAAVRSADTAAAALVSVIAEQVEPRTSGQGFAAVPPVSAPPTTSEPLHSRSTPGALTGPSLSAPMVGPPVSVTPAPTAASAPPAPAPQVSTPPLSPSPLPSPSFSSPPLSLPSLSEPLVLPQVAGPSPTSMPPVSAAPGSASLSGPPSSAPPASGPQSSAPLASGPPSSAPPASGPPSSTPPFPGTAASAPPFSGPPAAAPPAAAPPAFASPLHSPPASAPPASAPPMFAPPGMSSPLPAAHRLGSQPPSAHAAPAQPSVPRDATPVEQQPVPPLPTRSVDPSPNTDELPTTSGFAQSIGPSGVGARHSSAPDSSPYGQLGRPQGPVQPMAPHNSSAVPDQSDAELSLLSPDELPTSNIRRSPEPTRPSEPTSGRLGALIEFPRSARRQVHQQPAVSYGEQARRDTEDEPTQEYRPPSPRRHVPAEAPSSSPPVGDNDGDLLIFSQARSAWFTGDEDDAADQGDWRTDADVGWDAAEAASRPTVGGTTGSGLPRRVPSANLVPGAAPNRERAHVHPINRDAAQLAAHTAGYFRGWNRARQDVQEPPYPSVRHQ